MMTTRTIIFAGVVVLALSAPALLIAQGRSAGASVPVTIDTFIRAEADTYFAKKVEEARGVGKFNHTRTPVPITSDKQSIIRMNRDTI